jgi:hypothetical protein
MVNCKLAIGIRVLVHFAQTHSIESESGRQLVQNCIKLQVEILIKAQ